MVAFDVKNYYLKNKEKIQERARRYYQLYREERLAYQNEYNNMTEAERKQKNKERYWKVRDKNLAKATPEPKPFPYDFVPASFSVVFS